MALRELEDASGCRWRVWETAPARTTGLSERYQGGWLTFDCGAERRRLAPVPAGWEALPTERLLLLVLAAELVPRRFG